MLADGRGGIRRDASDDPPAVVAIVEDNFNYLTKMCTVRLREATHRDDRGGARRGCRVVVNGSDATDHPALYLDAGADAVLVGESGRHAFRRSPRPGASRPMPPLAAIPGLALRGGRR